MALDVTDDTFETEVIEQSRTSTVVIDLWAPWCGPCRTLGPIIEKVVSEREPDVTLVKINVDENPRASATFQVQSIPAVYAVRDGEVIDGFVGALGEGEIRKWLDRVVPAPTEVDNLVEAGDEGSLRAALEMDPGHVVANEKLAALLAASDRAEEALEILERIPESAETRRISALARHGGTAPDTTAIVAELDQLILSVRDDEAARARYLELLELLEPGEQVEFRRKLSSQLF